MHFKQHMFRAEALTGTLYCTPEHGY